MQNLAKQHNLARISQVIRRFRSSDWRIAYILQRVGRHEGRVSWLTHRVQVLGTNLRLDFDCRVRLMFQGSQLSSDGGLLIVRELDNALGLSDLVRTALSDS